MICKICVVFKLLTNGQVGYQAKVEEKLSPGANGAAPNATGSVICNRKNVWESRELEW